MLFAACVPLCDVGCLNLCGNQILSDTVSPRGDKHAVIFERHCGATTDFSVQLSILDAKDQLANDGGNTFVEEGNRGTVSVYLTVRWLSPDRIVVAYPRDARIVHQEGLVKGVRVSYAPDGAP